jgi:KUP system potassium uptake protein
MSAPRKKRSAPATPSTSPPGHCAHGATSALSLMIGAVGVVYGDIGTSPLYAIKECFSPDSPHHVEPTQRNVLGVLSLVFWSLTMVITSST